MTRIKLLLAVSTILVLCKECNAQKENGFSLKEESVGYPKTLHFFQSGVPQGASQEPPKLSLNVTEERQLKAPMMKLKTDRSQHFGLGGQENSNQKIKNTRSATGYPNDMGYLFFNPSSVNIDKYSDEENSQSPSKIFKRTTFYPDSLRRNLRDLGMSHYPRSDVAPKLRYTPVEQTVSPGSPVTLKCSAQGSPSPVITWTRDHQPLINSHRTRVGNFLTSVGEIVSHVNLSDITVRDGGLYTCTAHNIIGSTSHTARINVYGSPFIRSMPNVTAVAGKDVHIFCPAGGYPTPSITWRKNGQPLPNSHRLDRLQNGSLIVRNAGHSDVGQYSCVASNRQGQTAASHTFLQILVPPEIETFSFKRQLEEGQRTSVVCTVNSGDLPMTINWLKDGRHMQHDPDLESKQISDYSTVLLFDKLREHHSGSYTCEAANAAAKVNHTDELRVKVSPRWVIEPRGSSSLVGATVIIECNAQGFPQPVITWKKASSESGQDFNPVIMDGMRVTQSANGSLIIKDSTRKDAGWYLCLANNSIGKGISKAVQLIVQASAHILTEGGLITGHSGQSVAITCEGTGDSPLTLTWHRHHSTITSTHRVSIRETEGEGLKRTVLGIRLVTTDDAGPYICRAENQHGHSTQTFTLAIIEPPVAPSNVIISKITSKTAAISWTLVQPATVTIQYKEIKAASWEIHGRNISVGQWATSHIVTGLTPYKTYAVRLLAHNDIGVSTPTQTQIFTTREEAPSGSPRDVQVTTGGSRSLIVQWRPPDTFSTYGPLRGYILEIRQQHLQGQLMRISRPVIVAHGTSGLERYEVTGLNPTALYEVAVRAFNKAGSGPLSTPRIVQATAPDVPSCPPGGVACRGSGRGAVRVWWSPPQVHCVNAPVTGYTILASPSDHMRGYQTHANQWEVMTTNLEKSIDNLPSAANISVRVKAFNEIGASPPSNPVFCLTEDDVPGPPLHVRVIVTGSSSLLVTWLPPNPSTGDILHYTLYSAREEQVAVRDVVGAGGSEATWKELSNLTPGVRVQVWVTATTVAGEGNASPRITAAPMSTKNYRPIAVGSGQTLRVRTGASVTLGCRGMGTPPPIISWTKGIRYPISNGHFTQILPGGDLHLTGVRESSNFTCWVKNNAGTDSLTHQVIVTTVPDPPILNLESASHDSLNISIITRKDGGAPILGYTLHHRGEASEWTETNAEPGSSRIALRGLTCGSSYSLYITAWNSQGTSTPSPVLMARTQGKSPGRPEPESLVEGNDTCVSLRLYAWPERGCAIMHWKVDLSDERHSNLWQPLHSHVSREKTDIDLCNLVSSSSHLLKLTAVSSAGDTSVIYRIAGSDHNGGLIMAGSIQEVQFEGENEEGELLDVHVLAGIVSALLLTTAFIICICVVIKRHKYGGYRQEEGLVKKAGGEDDNARNCEISRSHLYSPTPTKKSRGSLASLKTQGDVTDQYEIYPYSTLSIGNSEATLEYGLSLQAMTPRDCLDHPTYSHILEPPSYRHAARRKSQSLYKETEIAYISNTRGREADYASLHKSIAGHHPANSIHSPSTESAGKRDWTDEETKDTEGYPEDSKSQTQAEDNRRDLSGESYDASSPTQNRQHYQQPKMINPQHHLPHLIKPINAQQERHEHQHLHSTFVVAPIPIGRNHPHPLPHV